MGRSPRQRHGHARVRVSASRVGHTDASCALCCCRGAYPLRLTEACVPSASRRAGESDGPVGHAGAVQPFAGLRRGREERLRLVDRSPGRRRVLRERRMRGLRHCPLWPIEPSLRRRGRHEVIEEERRAISTCGVASAHRRVSLRGQVHADAARWLQFGRRSPCSKRIHAAAEVQHGPPPALHQGWLGGPASALAASSGWRRQPRKRGARHASPEMARSICPQGAANTGLGAEFQASTCVRRALDQCWWVLENLAFVKSVDDGPLVEWNRSTNGDSATAPDSPQDAIGAEFPRDEARKENRVRCAAVAMQLKRSFSWSHKAGPSSRDSLTPRRATPDCIMPRAAPSFKSPSQTMQAQPPNERYPNSEF
eukprot:scaffold368_cov258-Pinguiococcus_pyrenoidosus.AAC.79